MLVGEWQAAEAVARLLVVAGIDLVWQSALLAVLLALLLRLCRAEAPTRYRAWALALALLPVWPFLGRLSLAEYPAEEVVDSTVFRVRAVQTASSALAGGQGQAPGPGMLPLSLPSGAWPLAVVAVWGVGGLLGLVRLGRAAVAVSRLKRRAGPVDPQVEREGETLRRRLGVRRPVRWLQEGAVVSPLVAGYWRPAVILPRSLLAELDSGALRQVLVHELAHLRRWDDWQRLWQGILNAVFFFVPAFWALSRRLELERESCCDRWVLRHAGGGRDYAALLLRLAEKGRQPDAGPALLGSAGSQLGRRVERVLAAPASRGGALPANGAVVLGVGCIGALFLYCGSPLTPGAAGANGLSLVRQLEKALTQRDPAGYARLLARDFLYIEKDCSGAPLFYTSRRDEVRLVGQGVLGQAQGVDFAFAVQRSYRETAADNPKLYAGDPDGHPEEDWHVLHGQGSWAVAAPSRAAQRSEQQMTLKLRWDEEGWSIVRWIDVPTECGAPKEGGL